MDADSPHTENTRPGRLLAEMLGLEDRELDVAGLAPDVLSDLVSFFARHYEGGELLSPPRDDTGVYRVPHDGREVVLHWANADQHFVGTAERRAGRYTRRDGVDRFVHRDLGGFLRRELDFFVKTDVLALDDLDAKGGEALGAVLARVRAIRTAGGRIIDALDRIERLRLRSFLRKKLVLRTEWLVSVSYLPDELRALVEDAPAQRASWEELYGPGAGPDDGFVADTGLLGTRLRDRVVASFPDVSAALSGQLLRGDNFHALRLLAAELAGKVRVTYIDPPYNTGGDGFGYRDAYGRSSWLSMMRDRIALGRSLASRDGAIAVSIDDAEMHRLRELLERVYGPELAKLVWDRNRKNDARFFSVGHEYMLVHAADLACLRESGTVFREPKEGLEEARSVFAKLRKGHGEDWEAIRAGWIRWFETIPVSDPRRRMLRYTRVGPRGPYRADGDVSWPGGGGPRYEVLHPVTGRPVRIPSRGWVYPDIAGFQAAVEAGRVVFGPDETTSPGVARYLFDAEEQVMPSVFYSYAQAAAREFDALFGRRVFDNPKNWRDLARVIRYLGDPGCWVLDFFGGSGSTAHAVMALNRGDGGRRRFALVEAGGHGDTVLIPRLQKAAYATEWRAGRPMARSPVPVLVKVAYLEPYDLAEVEPDTSALGAAPIRKPWHHTIAMRPDAGDTVLRAVGRPNPFGEAPPEGRAFADLVETFNYLLGLRVARYVPVADGLLFVLGTDPEGLRTLVVWRDEELWSNRRLEEKCREALVDLDARSLDVLYVNGDGDRLLAPGEGERWEVRVLEDAFRARMFDTSYPS